MRAWFRSVTAALLLGCAIGSPLTAQPPAGADKGEPAKAAEKYERDSSSFVIPYTLALIAVLLVLVLVCMPARRD